MSMEKPVQVTISQLPVIKVIQNFDSSDPMMAFFFYFVENTLDLKRDS